MRSFPSITILSESNLCRNYHYSHVCRIREQLSLQRAYHIDNHVNSFAYTIQNRNLSNSLRPELSFPLWRPRHRANLFDNVVLPRAVRMYYLSWHPKHLSIHSDPILRIYLSSTRSRWIRQVLLVR
ncbi:hypothetical protein AA313_de0208891 [Arthrobotrys entomopaga]|nr:hypothetical protein AA313_de0208891 [Arthrobotrys entomopaga]